MSYFPEEGLRCRCKVLYWYPKGQRDEHLENHIKIHFNTARVYWVLHDAFQSYLSSGYSIWILFHCILYTKTYQINLKEAKELIFYFDANSKNPQRSWSVGREGNLWVSRAFYTTPKLSGFRNVSCTVFKITKNKPFFHPQLIFRNDKFLKVNAFQNWVKTELTIKWTCPWVHAMRRTGEFNYSYIQ